MARDIRSRNFVEPELDLLRWAVRPGEVAVDIGANYGMYTTALSAAVGVRGRVYAFEPVPFTVMTLRRILRLLRCRNVEVIPSGCGDTATSQPFRIPVQTSGALSAGQAHLSTRRDDRPGHERHVRHSRTTQVMAAIVRVDDVVPTDADVVFLKADIEGAELFALRGAARTIERCKPVIVLEINPWFLEGFDLSATDVISFLTARGYVQYHYDKTLRRLESRRPEETVEANYVFVPAMRRDRLADLLTGGS